LDQAAWLIQTQKKRNTQVKHTVATIKYKTQKAKRENYEL